MNPSRAMPVFVLIVLVVAAACAPVASEPPPPTATLAPIVSRTPRATATPIPSRTPVPTFTFTPSETSIPPTPSDTPTPTPTPPVFGSVNAIQSINVRTGPDATFAAFRALPPASRVEILGTNTNGRWLNVRLDDGQEGWVAADLIRIQPTLTPFPSATPTPDETQLAQSDLPTALFGGGTVTPSPPRSLVGATPTALGGNAPPPPADAPLNAQTAVAELQLPNIEAINQTATALSGGALAPTVDTLAVLLGTPAGTATPAPILGGPTGGPVTTLTPQSAAPAGTAQTLAGAIVLAYCDDPIFASPAPRDLAAGSTIRIFWRWYAATPELVQQHLDAAIYQVSIDGIPLDFRLYRTGIREAEEPGVGRVSVVEWFVPAGPLAAGQHRIDYRVTWSRAISDGFANFGPGTGTPVETGSCTFTVR